MEKFERFLTPKQVNQLAEKFNKTIGFGTEVYGIKAPMFQKGEDLSFAIAQNIVKALELRNMSPRTDDIFAITEAVAAKDITQGPMGNIVTPDLITKSFREKTGGGHVVLANPIYSRNRMAHLIEPFSKGVNDLSIILGLIEDEQGNSMINRDNFLINNKNVINPSKLFTKQQVEEMTGQPMKHGITGVNYGDMYQNLGKNISVYYALDPATAAATNIKANAHIAGDVHTKHRTMNVFNQYGLKNTLSLADIMNAPINGSGFNPDFGVLGSNKLGDLIKLFPRKTEATQFLNNIIGHIQRLTGVRIERALVFGDGAYKDPDEKIWELADPVVAPASIGLDNMPNEVKVKDRNEYYKGLGLSDKEAAAYTQYEIDNKSQNMQNLGTTPRKLKNLIGSLADLTSGSGDKSTPIVYIRNY